MLTGGSRWATVGGRGYSPKLKFSKLKFSKLKT
jgi:hypothetical protein